MFCKKNVILENWNGEKFHKGILIAMKIWRPCIYMMQCWGIIQVSNDCWCGVKYLPTNLNTSPNWQPRHIPSIFLVAHNIVTVAHLARILWAYYLVSILPMRKVGYLAWSETISTRNLPPWNSFSTTSPIITVCSPYGNFIFSLRYF